jgi:hypothetical protein
MKYIEITPVRTPALLEPHHRAGTGEGGGDGPGPGLLAKSA